MRSEVRELGEMGPLPSSDVAAEDLFRLEEYQRLLESIEKPVSDEEAIVLLELFGPDECFGLAWAVVHLVESAPGWPLHVDMPDTDNDWLLLLRERAARGSTL
jgi:hypothetical protein